MKSEWTISSFSPEDRVSLLDFMVRGSGNKEKRLLRASEYVDWIYSTSHPNETSILPGKLLILKKEGKVHGVAGIMKMNMASRSGDNVIVNLVRDFRVSREARGRGVALARAVRNLPEPTCGLANEEALVLWRMVTRGRPMFEISPFEICSVSIRKYTVRSFLKFFSVSWRFFDFPEIDSSECSTILKDSPLRAASSYSSGCLFTHPDRLHWRYSKQPGVDYTINAIIARNRLTGFFVTHEYADADSMRSMALDELVIPAARPDILMGVTAYLFSIAQDRGISKLVSLKPPYTLYRNLMTAIGFRPEPMFKPFPTFIIHRYPPGTSPRRFSEKSGWYYPLSLG
jgi:hypothetical protein